MRRAANRGVPANYFADAPTLSAESGNLGRRADHSAGEAGREAAGEPDSVANLAAPMIAAEGDTKQTAGGGDGVAAACTLSRSKGAVR